MANVKFSGLPVATTITPTDYVAIVQGGVSKQSPFSNLWEATPVGNANYTILATDVMVYTSVAFTLARTWTLPSAASYGAGRALRVVDLLATITGTNTLTISRAGSDTIVNGTTSTTKVLSTAGQAALLVSDGVSAWSVIALAISGGSGTVTTTGSPTNQMAKFSGATSITNAVAKTDYWDTTVFVASGASHAIGLVPDPGASAGTTKFLREDATWVAIVDFVASGGSHAHGLVPDPGASAGTTKFLREDATWQVPSGGSGGLLAFAGSLTSNTTVNMTTTDTTGGITLASQTAAASTLWRIKAHGIYTGINAAGARNAQITAYWGSTALGQISWSIPASTANTFNWEGEFLLNGTSTTAIWESGYVNCINSAGTVIKSTWLTPASTSVTSGAQTIDLRFSMSASTPADSWTIYGVTIERLK